MQEQRNMAQLQAFVEEGQRSEQRLQHRLQALKDAHRQQLLQAERRQRESLDKRIQQNSLLSAAHGDGSADRQLEEFFNYEPRRAGLRRTSSMSDLTSSKGSMARTSRPVGRSERPVTASTPPTSTTAAPKDVPRTPKVTHAKGPHRVVTATEAVRSSREEEEEEELAECRRKFRAVPAPAHVLRPLYREIVDGRERERRRGHDERRDFLLSTQKPFSFLERDERKREELIQALSAVAQTQKTTAGDVRKPVPKSVKDPAVSEHLKAEELSRKIRIQARAQEMLRNSRAPIETQPGPGPDPGPDPRMAYLDAKPTFQPRINSQVPDFDRLHKAFQAEALRKAERREATRCRPFCLRTSTLPTRASRTGPENAQEPTFSARLKRNNSTGVLTSLSTDTLPTYITDAARKRSMAIRTSMERNESQRQESAEWMRKHRMRSQALKKAVVIRAKVLDPHSSLKEVYHEKLKQCREADQQRTREYRKELQDMKARVTVRPYLFEQVTQRNAKAEAERTFRSKLKEAGLNELFVETKGQPAGVTSASISDKEDDDDDDDDDDADDQSIERDLQASEADTGGRDDGEKIEEVEETSVKTKEEETP